MPIKAYEDISSISAYLDITRTIRRSWPQQPKPERTGDEEKLWFRGQARWQWGLSPKLYRPAYLGADEDEIRLEFQTKAIQLIPGRMPSTKWDWYFLMQHHFVPTRLLDWTENSLVALFFAVEEEDSSYDSAVWVIDPWWLNQHLHLGVRGPILPEYSESNSYLRELEEAFQGRSIRRNLPAAIEPPHVDRRVAAQSSRFLVFGTTNDLAKAQLVRKRNARLAKIRIPAHKRATLRKELDDCGINFSLVYPDLEGLARHLLWRWKTNVHSKGRK